MRQGADRQYSPDERNGNGNMTPHLHLHPVTCSVWGIESIESPNEYWTFLLSSPLVKHRRWCLCACRMGPPVEQLDRDDHTRACETQVEGEESQSEVSTCAPPPVSKKKRRSKRYFSVCLHYRAISGAHVASASVGCCSEADVCPAFCLLSFRWLWINLTNCKYGSGMWRKTFEHPLSC